MNTNRTRRFTALAGTALIAGAIFMGTGTSAMATEKPISSTTQSVNTEVDGNYFSGGVSINITNNLDINIEVVEMMKDGYPKHTIAPGESFAVRGSRVDNHGNPINFSIAKVTVDGDTFNVTGMNGSIGYPSVRVEGIDGISDWGHGFYEDESDTRSNSTHTYQVTRESDGDRQKPGNDDNMKNFHLTISKKA